MPVRREFTVRHADAGDLSLENDMVEEQMVLRPPRWKELWRVKYLYI